MKDKMLIVGLVLGVVIGAFVGPCVGTVSDMFDARAADPR